MFSVRILFTRIYLIFNFSVFADRLNDDKDREQFNAILAEKLGTHMDVTFHSICQNRIPPTFGDFVSQDEIYEDLVDFDKLKAHMEKILKDYNETPGTVPMDLVLFRDAILHVTRIVRVIRQPRGNMLLIGIGGSGRQSLAKLASFICNYAVFKIEIAKNYRRNEFREDIKRLYKQAGVSNRETTFIFVDTQAVEETFFEDINNILSSGEVPNLLRADELEELKTSMSSELRKEGIDEENNQEVYSFLLDRVKANLHMVVCMSPVGEVFR
jgi:dynein heavy chain